MTQHDGFAVGMARQESNEGMTSRENPLQESVENLLLQGQERQTDL